MTDVGDIFIREVGEVDKEADLQEILEVLGKSKESVVFVVDNGKKIGYITPRSLLIYVTNSMYSMERATGAMGMKIPYFGDSAKYIMETLVTITLNSSLDDALLKMVTHRRTVLPVSDEEGEIKGIVHLEDILRARVSK